MTKQKLQQELLEEVKEGVKPSDLKKLKRSKSADDIPSPSTPIPLKKTQSQLEIPLTQPNSKEQISNLKEQVKFHAETAANYLKSLQSSQARVSELEGKIKNPPSSLLQDQLKEKQKEVEKLREQLEEKNEELEKLKETHSSVLDDNLTLKHQSLKDWWHQYEKTKELESELKENVDYASNELLNQDKVIEKLRSEVDHLKLNNQSLTKDLNLATKLAELRKNPLPNNKPNWDYLKLALYSMLAVAFTLWLVKSFKNIQGNPNNHD